MKMLYEELKKTLEGLVEAYHIEKPLTVEVTIPDSDFGDASTNIALKLAPLVGSAPRQIAEELSRHLEEKGYRSEVAGPGFINIRFSVGQLWHQSLERDITIYDKTSVIVEYSCPNYFKEIHAGHLYQTILGDSIARLIERQGAVVHRTNFGADVGLSAARALWGIIQHLGGEHPEKLSEIPVDQRTRFIAERYKTGAEADSSDNAGASTEIRELNKRIYALHAQNDTESDLARIYFECRDWCKEYFLSVYAQLRVHEFEKYYPESTTEQRGLQEVRSALATGIFMESDGAVIFPGEEYGLHTRVFVTKEGLPTYETKDLGLLMTQKDDFNFSMRILITGSEQREYMKVVWTAADMISQGMLSANTHITNGLIRFGDGKKMSSRLGNVMSALEVLAVVRELVGESGDNERDERITLGAVKYELLKHRIGSDIAFDPNQSVSLQGDSGPYLQYALVRARSIMEKADLQPLSELDAASLNESERGLLRKLAQYQYILAHAAFSHAPQHICAYLYELAQEFNRFYEINKVIGSAEEAQRLALIRVYVDTLTDGLGLLGIHAPETM